MRYKHITIKLFKPVKALIMQSNCKEKKKNRASTEITAFTLQDRMFPNAENVSYRALLSMDLSRFLMKMFPTPLFLNEGSRWDHMMRRGLPLITSKFIVSKARSAESRTAHSAQNIHHQLKQWRSRWTPTISWLLEVHVGIAKRPAGDHVSAHPDGEDGSGRAELLVQHGLGDVRMQVSYVEGGHGVAGRAGIHDGLRAFSDSQGSRFNFSRGLQSTGTKRFLLFICGGLNERG